MIFFNTEIENIFNNSLSLDESMKISIFNRNIDLLSGGQKIILQIIRICLQTIIYNKQLIIIDEPNSGLDSIKTEIIIVTH